MITQRELYIRHVAQPSSAPMALEIKKAEGIYLYDVDDNEYIDLISGISVSNVGHRHPKVIEAIKDQLDKYTYLMVYGKFIQEPQVDLAKRITNLLPSQLDNVYFVNSGTEATEGALKLAKRFTGRYELISCHKAYHGSTHGALSILGDDEMKKGYRPLLPDCKLIHFNNHTDLDLITEKTAAVMVEVVQGEAGSIVGDKAYLQALRKRCTEVGCLMIIDEVQTGFGRTGKLFAFEHFGIAPDIFTIAKGMGGGMPIGAFISSKEIMGVFKANPMLGHITTFGGHAVSCAASLASLNVLIDDKLIEQVEAKGELFRSLLIHDKIKVINGKGLMLALDFGDSDFRQKVVDNCVKNRLITDWFLYNQTSMRIAPPLIITEDQIKTAAEIILAAINEAAA
ncbi:MAG: aspartate aminotransferase family protein [Flavobacteriales bacterium]|nr:aspartate aminotransferase family protein [Flavobacteriales bacterium]